MTPGGIRVSLLKLVKYERIEHLALYLVQKHSIINNRKRNINW